MKSNLVAIVSIAVIVAGLLMILSGTYVESRGGLHASDPVEIIEVTLQWQDVTIRQVEARNRRLQLGGIIFVCLGTTTLTLNSIATTIATAAAKKPQE
jgi:hypothetical protein